MADVPMHVISDNTSSERRITPSWTISQLRGKLEHITGVPPSSQKLSIKTPSGVVPVEAADEDSASLASFPLAPYAELHVRPAPLLSDALYKLHLAPSRPGQLFVQGQGHSRRPVAARKSQNVSTVQSGMTTGVRHDGKGRGRPLARRI